MLARGRPPCFAIGHFIPARRPPGCSVLRCVPRQVGVSAALSRICDPVEKGDVAAQRDAEPVVGVVVTEQRAPAVEDPISVHAGLAVGVHSRPWCRSLGSCRYFRSRWSLADWRRTDDHFASPPVAMCHVVAASRRPASSAGEGIGEARRVRCCCAKKRATSGAKIVSLVTARESDRTRCAWPAAGCVRQCAHSPVPLMRRKPRRPVRATRTGSRRARGGVVVAQARSSPTSSRADVGAAWR